jgi:hypothetical protein
LREVERVPGSGSGVLDATVVGEGACYTWDVPEDTDRVVENLRRVESTEEYRLLLCPEGNSFVCELSAEADERDAESVRCYHE